MKDIAKQGYELGISLKKKNLKNVAKNELMKALNDYATYEDKIHCLLKLAEKVDKSIPFTLIEEENSKDLRTYMFGVVTGINKAIDDVVTVKEASKITSKDVSSINRAIKSGRLIEGTDCRRSGTTWLIEKSSLLREFSEEE